MTTTLAAVIDGIVATLESAGWRAYGYAADNPSPPCAEVFPVSAQFEQTMGLGSDEWEVRVDLLWPTNSGRVAWQQAYDAIDAAGFRAHLTASPQVGETGCDVLVSSVELLQSEATPRYLMARFVLRVLIDGQ